MTCRFDILFSLFDSLCNRCGIRLSRRRIAAANKKANESERQMLPASANNPTNGTNPRSAMSKISPLKADHDSRQRRCHFCYQVQTEQSPAKQEYHHSSTLPQHQPSPTKNASICQMQYNGVIQNKTVLPQVGFYNPILRGRATVQALPSLPSAFQQTTAFSSSVGVPVVSAFVAFRPYGAIMSPRMLISDVFNGSEHRVQQPSNLFTTPQQCQMHGQNEVQTAPGQQGRAESVTRFVSMLLDEEAMRIKQAASGDAREDVPTPPPEISGDDSCTLLQPQGCSSPTRRETTWDPASPPGSIVKEQDSQLSDSAPPVQSEGISPCKPCQRLSLFDLLN